MQLLRHRQPAIQRVQKWGEYILKSSRRGNLLPDGEFADVTQWHLDPGWSFIDGEAVFDGVPIVPAVMYALAEPFIVGRMYTFRTVVKAATGINRFYMKGGAEFGPVMVPGVNIWQHRATAVDINPGIQSQVTATITVDNLTVTEY